MKALVMNCSPVKNGATAEIVRIVAEQLSGRMTVKSVCIDDYRFSFCMGCRSCHRTAKCVMEDDIPEIMNEPVHPLVQHPRAPRDDRSRKAGVFHRAADGPGYEGMRADYPEPGALVRAPGDCTLRAPGTVLRGKPEGCASEDAGDN